jgi:hypothetical protein
MDISKKKLVVYLIHLFGGHVNKIILKYKDQVLLHIFLHKKQTFKHPSPSRVE